MYEEVIFEGAAQRNHNFHLVIKNLFGSFLGKNPLWYLFAKKRIKSLKGFSHGKNYIAQNFPSLFLALRETKTI